MRLLIFNPWHEEALASNDPHYTPTRAARKQALRFAESGTLPWAQPGDKVWYPGEKPNWEEIDRIEPWGWDRLLCTLLRKAGAPECLLPTEAELAAIRRLSSRALAVEVLPELKHKRFFGESAFCTSWEDIYKFAFRTGGEFFVLKSPYSCSGRGIVIARMKEMPGDKFFLGDTDEQARIANILARQGAIVIEPYYKHQIDVALEFCYEEGVLTETGLNVFKTTPYGQYLHNRSADVLTAFHRELLRAASEQLRAVLPQKLKSDYHGPLGVDMMLFADCLHPCVEINLRRTMGQV